MSQLIDAPIRVLYRVAHRVLRAYWRVRKPETHGALVALWFEGKILVIRSSYRATHSLPGGYVKRGETARDAALRELWEELGIRLPEGRVAHAWHGSLPFEHRKDTLDIFEAQLERPFYLEPDGRELVWADWKSPEDALAMNIVPHLAAYLTERQARAATDVA